MNKTRKAHWESVYETKNPNEVSWTQEKPTRSLEFIAKCGLAKNAAIIDIGGGDSKLIDFLLEEGYENITVLDISAKAIEKAKLRLGKRADEVRWIVSDIVDFKPTQSYDLWHDRAAFHFLTKSDEIEQYKTIVANAVTSHLILGTFSNEGPLKCSGLDISQYNESSLSSTFQHSFVKTSCLQENHVTPFGTNQNFVFCSFKKMS